MKILMLNYEFPPIGGGAGQANLQLLKQYAGNGELEIDMLTSTVGRGLICERFAKNITIHKIGVRKKNLHYWQKTEVIEWLFKAGSHYRKMIGKENYDLAHAFFAFPTGWLCYRNRKKLPYIISLRGSDVPGYNTRLSLDYKIMAGVFRNIWSNARAVIANSEGLNMLASKFMPNLKIGVIPNGIDKEKFHPIENKHKVKAIKALTVCRLISRKRIDLLIKAVARAKEIGLDVRLNIAGQGNLMKQLQSLADELNIADNIVFLGVVGAERMPQLYRENDIFIMSSAHEGMSNAMLEAMASGLPIITTRCEGVDELIKDNGVIVDNATAADLAASIKNVIDNPDVYQQMSKAARLQAERFSWQSVAQAYLQVYRKVAAH